MLAWNDRNSSKKISIPENQCIFCVKKPDEQHANRQFQLFTRNKTKYKSEHVDLTFAAVNTSPKKFLRLLFHPRYST